MPYALQAQTTPERQTRGANRCVLVELVLFNSTVKPRDAKMDSQLDFALSQPSSFGQAATGIGKDQDSLALPRAAASLKRSKDLPHHGMILRSEPRECCSKFSSQMPCPFRRTNGATWTCGQIYPNWI